MYNLPINRDNESWAKINYQFLKGGFDWYNQKIPDLRRWYYNYYLLDGSEKYCCLKIAWYRRRNKVTCWLRNIEKFEEIKKKYEKEDKKKDDEENWKKKNREWRKENSMSWRRTKYEQ
jgi:hypothetical protein